MNKKIKIDTKKIEKILVALFIIILILVIAIMYFDYTDSTKASRKKLEYINSDEWNDEIFPEGMPKFIRNYNGNLTAQNIGKSIYYIVTEAIPEYNIQLRDKNEEQIKEYFNSNKENIALDLGITEENDFIMFMREIKKVRIDTFEIDSFSIDSETIISKSTYTTGDLYIKYKDCNEICFKIRVQKDKQQNISAVKYYK